jgi:hypothetical protein
LTASPIGRVNAFLEKHNADAVSGFRQKTRKPLWRLTFYGSEKLAKAVASAFSKNKVISALDGGVLRPF